MYQLCYFDRNGYSLGQVFFWDLREAARAARVWSREPFVRTTAIFHDGGMYAGRYVGGKYKASRSPATY